MIRDSIIKVSRSKLKVYRLVVCVALGCLGLLGVQAQVTLSTDFTSSNDRKSPLHDIWGVANRISLTNGSNVREGLKLNIVRMIGGINKVNDGVATKDLAFDPCLYDSINNVYVYKWKSLIARLDKVINSQTEIFQIVLDQPPWAFQHGYTFIPNDKRDGVHFREREKMSKYGNSLPPANKEAYHAFIKALMTKLVETYGEEKVLSWRFRIGSEIETPEHWYGTRQDFIEHFANSEKAIRSVLPQATIGVHTREPGFFKKKLNYKGAPFASFIDELIAYNHANDVQCDFWGISDYITIGNRASRNMKAKYAENFAPLVENPKWNPHTTVDLMEYSTVTTMNGADGRGVLVTCDTSHRDIIELAYSHLFYKNNDKGLRHIYRWSNGIGSKDPEGIAALKKMLGMIHYKTTAHGNPKVATNALDAIFAKDEEKDEFDALLYNYNSHTLEYLESEPVKLSFTTDLPVGTRLFYRSKSYTKANNKLQNFLVENSNFVKKNFDSKGDPRRTLTREGYKAFKRYNNPSPPQFTEWKSTVTTAVGGDRGQSKVSLSIEMESFSFIKYQFKKSLN